MTDCDLEKQIREILRREGLLNTTEICRLLNGFNKREVERCHFTFKERPWHSAKLDSKRPSCRILENNCKISYERVRGTLLKMHGVFSVKLVFWDKNKTGKKFDTFRFWFLRFSDFMERICNQTLISVEEVA
jgi:hypothetical protein